MDCCGKKSEKKSSNESAHNHLKSNNENVNNHSSKGHFWMMFGCIGLVVVVLIVSYFLNFKSGYAIWILLAACIGMHLFMMKGHKH